MKRLIKMLILMPVLNNATAEDSLDTAMSESNLASIGLSLDKNKYPLDEIISPQQEFWSYVNQLPSVKDYFENLAPTRNWLRTGQLQDSSERAAGEGWVMMSHAYGFIDALLSRGMIKSKMGDTSFYDRVNIEVIKKPGKPCRYFEAATLLLFQMLVICFPFRLDLRRHAVEALLIRGSIEQIEEARYPGFDASFVRCFEMDFLVSYRSGDHLRDTGFLRAPDADHDPSHAAAIGWE
ncbi:MAG: hypothetical protein O6928_01195 [Gammaproteobacteria bacterium]|nr:hypothetical protein [Gammaproteobacteria bacterium]